MQINEIAAPVFVGCVRSLGIFR